ncbi:glucosidase II beta subunit-like-domain-containing protein [Protomyces lactucae-debilis]|uniref:Glucosidase 2 subunit beta n=1 Tax=Protomyces lactucae-debilis TaxID=2754530 RepID=A0A1Y2FQR0_PROLT|nr:glucosidase II beta subunit-like-domain-containing protein [Protomyces lactucae-debilis]ORY85045.1 glucosidase II beta subunit-like-domain-containing protein [Protomyces lactucae-debilis]
MKHLLALAAAGLALSTTATSIRGLDSSKAAFYKPSQANTFRCLDGSKVIHFNKINDDYCDCPDGSDEPGTSACHNASFYCENVGHTPARIPARNVNDGVCEPACCDGSDEYGGLTQCPNTCAALAKEAAIVAAAREEIRTTGAAQQEAWSKAGRAQRTAMEASLVQKQAALSLAREKLKHAEDALEKAKATAPIEVFTTGSPAFEEARVAVEQQVTQLKEAVEGLQGKVKAQQERIAALESILSNLKVSYNPNFQDMAVKGAVSAFDELAAIEESTFPNEATLPELLADSTVLPTEVCPVPVPDKGIGALIHQFKRYMMDLGVIAHDTQPTTPPAGPPKQVQDASALVDKRKEELSSAEKEQQDMTSDLAQSYAADVPAALKDALRHLTGQCFSTRLGDYDYEVCMMKTLYQKSSSHGNTLVGTFESLKRVAEPVQDGALFGTTLQFFFTHGTRCWNGPERSGRVDVECGKSNHLVSVREAQKCEYVYRVTSPIACSLQQQQVVKDEL